MKFAFEVIFTFWLENLTFLKISKNFFLLLLCWFGLCFGTQKIPYGPIFHTEQGKDLKKSLNIFTINKPNHLQLTGTGEEPTGGARPERHLGDHIPDPDPFPGSKLCRVIGLQVGEIVIFFNFSKAEEMKKYEPFVSCRLVRKQYLSKLLLELSLYHSALFYPSEPYSYINYMGWYSGIQHSFHWPKKNQN